MRIVFMGTPDFAKESLKEIYQVGHEILAVVTNQDKPSGRGMKIAITPVKEYAQEQNIKIYQPQKVRNNEEFIKEIKEMNPEVICVVAYGKILPKEILEIPKKGCINVHASLLPKYRGAAPIQRAIINGEETTGVTTMYMDIGMDTGDMILKQEEKIGDDETTGELWERLSKIGAKLLVKTLEQIEQGKAPRTAQGDEYTMAPMLDKEKDGVIDWENKTAKEIKNQVRGLNPIMGAFTYIEGKKIKFWKVKVVGNDEIEETKEIKSKENGTIIVSDSKKGLYIKTREGIIKVLEIQGENAKKMPIEDYLRGNRIEVGKIFKKQL
ncbi:MAG: methionyl-tRNA formyltransferase [Clostridia bacterium]|nr:methionyl-tRNA formyltransferase [Clostridia bacterium]